MIFLTKAYQALIYYGGFLKSPLLLILRLYWGTLFMLAGWGKLIDIDKFKEGLAQHGFPFEHFLAYLVGYTEFLGGICLILGLASRLVAIPLIITMVTAYATVHVEAVKAFFQDPTLLVAEPPFNFLLTALLVLAFGPGRFSIDYMLEKYLFNRAESFPKHQHKLK
jgi:putative oxidoreductase